MYHVSCMYQYYLVLNYGFEKNAFEFEKLKNVQNQLCTKFYVN